MSALEGQYTRIDGKKLTDKQRRQLLEKAKEEEKRENPDFDPRKHRLIHGIRGYTEGGAAGRSFAPGAFQGQGVKIN